ncbi:AAA family ATPase [Cypionkella sp. TWP1-2-1b2]|uniref:AAA family ATPase n=1 Tax=Cypionkella sp. TWP1-2-1b2 TaxID=2804675 RepID=UPI003CF1DC5E
MALDTARPAIARGPAGIGKSFGLTLLKRSLSKNGDTVLIFTATLNNGRSSKRFFEEINLDFGIIDCGSAEPMQRLQRELMKSFPFCQSGQRLLLVIDECQHLDAQLIECLRALYDGGDYARNFDPSRPAFGMLLVGNSYFLSRRGKAERAAFEALLSRCPIEVTLERPEAAEHEALAKSYFPEDRELCEALAGHGKHHGNLRVMDTSYDIAAHFAEGGAITLAHLRKAFLFSAGGN